MTKAFPYRTYQVLAPCNNKWYGILCVKIINSTKHATDTVITFTCPNCHRKHRSYEYLQ